MEKSLDLKTFKEFLVPDPVFIVEQERLSRDITEAGSQLRGVSRIFSRLCDTGRKLCDDLSEAISALGGIDLISGDESFETLNLCLKSTRDAFTRHFSHISESVVAPLNEIVSVDVEEIQSFQKSFEKASTAYNAASDKHLGAQKSEKSGLIAAHQQFTTALFDFSWKTTLVESKMKASVTALIIEYIGSFAKCFSKALRDIEKKKPMINEIQAWTLEMAAARREMELKEIRDRKKLNLAISQYWDQKQTDETQEVRQNMQGYLWKKTRFNWKKKFFICSNGVLSYAKSFEHALKSPKNIDLTLFSVTQDSNPQKLNTFIVRSKEKTIYLQALTKWEMNAWINAIRQNIINQSDGSNPISRGNNHTESPDSVCADCGCPSANWASINWGVNLCSACAGIHRSLPSSLTMVRSLELDDIPPVQRALINEIGSIKANSILEAEVKDKKIDMNANSQQKRTFIQQKYQNLQFVNRESNESHDIFEAIKSQDLLEVYRCLILTKGSVPKINEFTPFHAAVCIGNPLIIQLIALHLPQTIDSLDENGWAPISYAAYYQSKQLVNFLMDLGADPNSSTDGHPWRIAKSLQNRDIELLLGACAYNTNSTMELPEKPYHDDFKFQNCDMTLITPPPVKGLGRRLSHFDVDSELRSTIKKFKTRVKITSPQHSGVKTLGNT